MPSNGFTLCLMLKFPWESHIDVPLINSPCVPNLKRGAWEPPTTSARCRCNHLTQRRFESPLEEPWHPWYHGCCDVVCFTLWLWLLHSHGLLMAHRNRWFTVLKNGGSFHGELLVITRGYLMRYNIPKYQRLKLLAATSKWLLQVVYFKKGHGTFSLVKRRSLLNSSFSWQTLEANKLMATLRCLTNSLFLNVYIYNYILWIVTLLHISPHIQNQIIYVTD